MDKAVEILDKHLELRSWTKTVPKGGNLYNTLIDAINEALSNTNEDPPGYIGGYKADGLH